MTLDSDKKILEKVRDSITSDNLKEGTGIKIDKNSTTGDITISSTGTEISNVATDTEDMGKALNSVQANPNVEGTLAKQIVENAEQINVLNGKLNGVKIYTTFTQINESGAVTTPIATLFGWMGSNSIAMIEISALNTEVYPAKYGICIIHKNNANRNGIEFVDVITGNKYVGTCHSSFDGGFSGWQQLVTVTQLNNALSINRLTQV